jgi:peptidoglycan/LPS O-acetylase OafA/YrhL
MLRMLSDFRSRRSSTEKAEVARRLQRLGLIIVCIGLAVVFAEMGIGCALIPRRCAPAISFASAGICMAMLVPVLLAFRNPMQRWTVKALAMTSIVALACLFVLMVNMP